MIEPVRHLRRNGHEIGHRRARRLMAKMGLTPIYQRPRTSDPHPQHRVYPYLLRRLAIERPNRVWCADVTYIPMHRGFLYLVAGPVCRIGQPVHRSQTPSIEAASFIMDACASLVPSSRFFARNQAAKPSKHVIGTGFGTGRAAPNNDDTSPEARRCAGARSLPSSMEISPRSRR